MYLNYRNLLGFVNTAALTKLRTRTISYSIVIVARVKFEPESSSSHESSSSQFSFYIFFLNTVFFCTVNIIVKKISTGDSFQLEADSFAPFLDFKHTPAHPESCQIARVTDHGFER